MKLVLVTPSDDRAERFADAFAVIGELVGSLPVEVRATSAVERADTGQVAKIAGPALAVVGGAALLIRRRARAKKPGAQSEQTSAPPAAPSSSAAVSPGDDATLKAKVETELFRDDSVPKGDINVNAVGGVVTLRGQVPDGGLRSRLEDEARRIPGVRDVQNLLHGPEEAAAPAAPPSVEEVKERLADSQPQSGLSGTPAAGGEDRSTDGANVGTGEERTHDAT